MKILKNTLLSLLALLVILSPLMTVVAVIFATPKVYEETIYGELDDKFRLLTETKEDKIVVIGGSSVAFGLDSEALSEQTGMPVVNFGLYAAIGTKAMLDLSLAGIEQGDIVVLAPELDAQTMSMYFSSEHILPALDEDYSMLGCFDGSSLMTLLRGVFDHAGEKLKYSFSPIALTGIYKSENFNTSGDIKQGLRPNNVMQLYYDPSARILLDESIVESEFLNYLNNYISVCKERGATVYFSYCPMNESALAENTTQQSKKDFEKYLKKNIKCDFISLIDDYIYDKAYFYDTNYHLNDTGVKLRTVHLAQDLLLAMGDMRLLDTDIAPPPLPELDVRYFGQEDENSLFFTYEKMDNGAYMISGLSELGRSHMQLTVPLGYNGYKVTAVGEGAFSDSVLKALTVSADTNLRNFFSGAFDGSSINDLYIYYDFTSDEDKLSPCGNFGGITIHVPKGSAYEKHYDWTDSAKGFTLKTDIEAP